MSNIQQSFEAGKSQAKVESQADRAVESVKDAAGSTVDSAQQQEHRAAGVIEQTGEQVIQMAQGAATAVKDAAVAVKDAVTGGGQ